MRHRFRGLLPFCLCRRASRQKGRRGEIGSPSWFFPVAHHAAQPPRASRPPLNSLPRSPASHTRTRHALRGAPQGGGASSSAMPARQDAAPPCGSGLLNDALCLPPPSASPRSGETSRLAVSDAGRIRPPDVNRPIPHLNSQTPGLPAATAIPRSDGPFREKPRKTPLPRLTFNASIVSAMFLPSSTP